MGYHLKGRTIDTVGVVGSGNIGPDIALHFAQTLSAAGVRVVVVDVAQDALDRGRAKADQKIAKARDSGALTPEAAEAVARSLTFTTDYEALRGAGLVVEAATENIYIKRRIFERVAPLCGPVAILASNSSHIEPEEIFATLPPEVRARSLVLHYFFPAERNPLVEVVSGRETSAAVADAMMAFYEQIGKVPVRVASRFGFAVNPIFEGLFLAAALAVESGLGSVKEVDAAARRALGLGVGPFTAMNLTGGNPITHHSLDVMTSKLGAWFRSPRLMHEAIAAGKPWDVARRDERVELDAGRERAIADAMCGAYFGLAGDILDSGMISLSDLEMSVELGLAMRAPFAFMNELGVDKTLALVKAYAAALPGFAIPRCITERAATREPFRIDHVFRRDVDGVAVLTIRRPKMLNALSGDVYEQLLAHVTAVRDDPGIVALVLTGFGNKSFVSGADVNFLAQIRSPAEGAVTSARSKLPGNALEQLGKPSVCALNGFAFGGGNELAMCCTARIVRKGLRVAVAQPEVNLGLIPGAGATQRLPRLVGVEKAAELLRTARALSSSEAVECGLIREEVDGDVVEAAIALARAAARGDVVLPRINTGAIEVPSELPPAPLAHLSHAVDALVCRAILEGCTKPLAQGLEFESELFGACCATKDMRIGVQNFITNGSKAKAEFVHA